MKLAHPDYGFQIDFSEGAITALFFDNACNFRGFVSELISQYEGEDGNFILSDDAKELNIHDNLALLLNPLVIDFDDKKIISKVNSMLKSFVVSEDMFLSTQSLMAAIERYAEDVIQNFQYPLRVETTDVASVLKMLSFKVEVEYQSELEKILEYMNLNHDICGIGAFVILNAFSYFTIEEIRLLAEDSKRLGHAILFIDSNSAISDEKLDFCRKIIVDNDGVEIF